MPTYEVPTRMVTEGKVVVEASNADEAAELAGFGEYEDFFEDSGYTEVIGVPRRIVE